MGFADGMRAGMELGRAYNEGQQRRQEKQFSDAVSATMRDYYSNSGDFASQPVPAADNEAATARANASYDRVIERKAGVGLAVPQPDATFPVNSPVEPNLGLRTPQQIETAVGQPVTRGIEVSTNMPAASAEQGPSLSMSAKDRVDYQGSKPLDQTDRAAKLYERLGAAAQFLPGDKALVWQENLKKLREQNYLDERKRLMTDLANGDRTALERFAPIYNKQFPDGNEIDVSQAQFKDGAWTGIQAKTKSGETRDIVLSEKEMMRMYMMSDLDKAAAYGFKLRDEDRKDKGEARADRAEGRADRADARADRQVGLAEEAGVRANIQLGLEARKIDADIANSKALMSYRWASLNVDKQRVELEKAVKEGDEKAKDLKTRQDIFLAEFSPGTGKLDPASPTYEEDKQRTEGGRRAAALATTIYGLSAEGAKPSERNRLQAEAGQFVRDFAARKADPSKLKDNGDGTVQYGNLRIPASLVSNGAAPAAAPEPPKPGLKAAASSGPELQTTIGAGGNTMYRYAGQGQWHASKAAAVAALGQPRMGLDPKLDDGL